MLIVYSAIWMVHVALRDGDGRHSLPFAPSQEWFAVLMMPRCRMYLIEGSASAFVAVCSYWILPDGHETTRWLNAREGRLAAGRIRQERLKESKDTESLWNAVRQTASDKRIWLFCLIAHAANVPQTFIYFFPTYVHLAQHRPTRYLSSFLTFGLSVWLTSLKDNLGDGLWRHQGAATSMPPFYLRSACMHSDRMEFRLFPRAHVAPHCLSRPRGNRFRGRRRHHEPGRSVRGVLHLPGCGLHDHAAGRELDSGDIVTEPRKEGGRFQPSQNP